MIATFMLTCIRSDPSQSREKLSLGKRRTQTAKLKTKAIATVKLLEAPFISQIKQLNLIAVLFKL